MHSVSVVRCDSLLTSHEVEQRTLQAITALPGWDNAFRKSRKIAIKINAGITRLRLTDGKQTELTDPAVIAGTLRAIREVTDAEIIIGDAPTDSTAETLYPALGFPEMAQRFGNVRFLDFGAIYPIWTAMRHTDGMFSGYWLHPELSEADTFVSIAKMKAHASLGVTLCAKNLFGWTPPSVYGSPRMYLHDRLIRLPRVVADLATYFQPCLNVVDGIVALNQSEWDGEPLKPNIIIAGDNIVTTDAAACRIMGCDPQGDYPDHPFFYRRNAIRLAEGIGAGSANLESVKWIGPPLEEIVVPFHVNRYSEETNRQDQLSQGARIVKKYIEDRNQWLRTHERQFLAFDESGLVWQAGTFPALLEMERASGRDWKTLPPFVVQCLPDIEEVERFEWYDVDCMGT